MLKTPTAIKTPCTTFSGNEIRTLGGVETTDICLTCWRAPLDLSKVLAEIMTRKYKTVLASEHVIFTILSITDYDYNFNIFIKMEHLPALKIFTLFLISLFHKMLGNHWRLPENKK